MRWFLSLAVLALLPSVTWGADATSQPDSFPPTTYDLDASSLTLTPEIWLYLQEQRRHDNPQMAVRRHAEQKAAERRSRLASMKWFGVSNQRPQANPTPLCGVYSPAWVGGLWQPYHWIGGGYPVVLLLTENALATAHR